MLYEKPANSFNQVDKAGIFFATTDPDSDEIDRDEFLNALNVLWNWRLAHAYPLNAIYVTLHNRAKRVDHNAVPAQRLKRYDSIVRKLVREQGMKLSRMQDIGGCRAVLSDLNRLNELVGVYKKRPVRSQLVDQKDYIIEPKDSGYRGIHLMYRFGGRGNSLPWDKLRVEMQIRTQLQHAWATAVETVDTFMGKDLKFGGGGEKWRRFFALMGSVHAAIEDMPIVPNTPDGEKERNDEIRTLTDELNVLALLKGWAQVTQHLTRGRRSGRRYWHVLRTIPEKRVVNARSYAKDDFERAKAVYAKFEQADEGTPNQTVLVSADSLSELKRAFPNYFADTAHFTETLEACLT